MKKAIVIGASSGIGNELAQILAQNQVHVGITGRRKTELEKLRASNPQYFTISSFDCTTANNAQKLTELVKEIGGLDLLILSAGKGDLNESLEFEIEDSTNKLNVLAFTEIVDWTFNYFEKQGKGHLVAITSIAGIRGSRFAPAYNASKAYQINYLEGLRQKAQKVNARIYITDIRPGFVDTDMAKGKRQFWIIPKEKAARQIFRQIKRRRKVGYISRRWRLIAIFLKSLPILLYQRM
jgi:short-subunit dehydrogenase